MNTNVFVVFDAIAIPVEYAAEFQLFALLGELVLIRGFGGDQHERIPKNIPDAAFGAGDAVGEIAVSRSVAIVRAEFGQNGARLHFRFPFAGLHFHYKRGVRILKSINTYLKSNGFPGAG